MSSSPVPAMTGLAPAAPDAATGPAPLSALAHWLRKGPASHDRSLVLDAADTAPGDARASLHECLSQWQLGHLEDDAASILSEIVANAVTASQEAAPEGDVPAAITVTIAADGDELWLSAWDPDPIPPPADYIPGTWDESGRGLIIVKALSYRWGTAPAANDGKHVYATLRTASDSCGRQPANDPTVP
jgi:anti-sigma regulatory factor (Ser/Thr protein kinase)